MEREAFELPELPMSMYIYSDSQKYSGKTTDHNGDIREFCAIFNSKIEQYLTIDLLFTYEIWKVLVSLAKKILKSGMTIRC
jgi:hypothetical protein